jgi:hypothetical protein
LVHKLGHKRPQTTKELLDITTSHASGKKAVKVIFDHARGKAKQDEDAGEGASNCSKKKKRSKQWSGDWLVATVERMGKKASAKGALDYFEKMLEGPYPNHTYPVKHAYKDCGLMKKFLARGYKKGDGKKEHDPLEDDTEETDDDGFSQTTGYLMIFGRTEAYASKR